jgi:hypothetical protein
VKCCCRLSYKQTIARTLEVYLQLAMDQINRTEIIETLTAVQHDPRNPENLFSPSWVPRWNYFVDAPNIGFWSNGSLASANRNAIITPTPIEAKSLVVRGTLLSRITFHTSLLNRSPFGIPTGIPEEVSLKAQQNPIIDTWFRRLADLDPQAIPYSRSFLTKKTAASLIGLHLMFIRHI